MTVGRLMARMNSFVACFIFVCSFSSFHHNDKIRQARTHCLLGRCCVVAAIGIVVRFALTSINQCQYRLAYDSNSLVAPLVLQ
jgi:hypothetical protein